MPFSIPFGDYMIGKIVSGISIAKPALHLLSERLAFAEHAPDVSASQGRTPISLLVERHGRFETALLYAAVENVACIFFVCTHGFRESCDLTLPLVRLRAQATLHVASKYLLEKAGSVAKKGVQALHESPAGNAVLRLKAPAGLIVRGVDLGLRTLCDDDYLKATAYYFWGLTRRILSFSTDKLHSISSHFVSNGRGSTRIWFFTSLLIELFAMALCSASVFLAFLSVYLLDDSHAFQGPKKPLRIIDGPTESGVVVEEVVDSDEEEFNTFDSRYDEIANDEIRDFHDVVIQESSSEGSNVGSDHDATNDGLIIIDEIHGPKIVDIKEVIVVKVNTPAHVVDALVIKTASVDIKTLSVEILPAEVVEEVKEIRTGPKKESTGGVDAIKADTSDTSLATAEAKEGELEKSSEMEVADDVTAGGNKYKMINDMETIAQETSLVEVVSGSESYGDFTEADISGALDKSEDESIEIEDAAVARTTNGKHKEIVRQVLAVETTVASDSFGDFMEANISRALGKNDAEESVQIELMDATALMTPEGQSRASERFCETSVGVALANEMFGDIMQKEYLQELPTAEGPSADEASIPDIEDDAVKQFFLGNVKKIGNSPQPEELGEEFSRISVDIALAMSHPLCSPSPQRPEVVPSEVKEELDVFSSAVIQNEERYHVKSSMPVSDSKLYSHYRASSLDALLNNNDQLEIVSMIPVETVHNHRFKTSTSKSSRALTPHAPAFVPKSVRISDSENQPTPVHWTPARGGAIPIVAPPIRRRVRKGGRANWDTQRGDHFVL
ncbi:hypothetical protein BDZ97DRAFT_1809718 [Flammula alnicola]|nr:hypothetical protein BDZ97DRAFT_1809718 [Flammula alnicola]